jgi:hypothetical protein
MTTPNQAEAPKPGTPEHDAAMAAKFENRDVTPDPAADATPAPAAKVKPEGIPDKFWNAEKGEVDVVGMAKSYAELEKSRAKKPEAAPAAAPADPAKAALESALAALKAKPDVKPEEIAAAEQALAGYKPAAASKLDLSSFEQEFAEAGALSAESYTKLEGMGFSRDTVDAYIAGQTARAEQYAAKAHAVVGGAEAFQQMTTWAANALTESEIAAFNDAVTSGNEGQMQLAIQGVHAKFVAANGQRPNLLGGDRPGASALGFRDKSEMTAAMRDPRYKTSEAYRKDVEARLMASNF